MMLKFDKHCVGCDQQRNDVALYDVTNHDDRTCIVAYCDDCAALAKVDWNGETKSCTPHATNDRFHIEVLDVNNVWVFECTAPTVTDAYACRAAIRAVTTTRVRILDMHIGNGAEVL